MNIKARCFFYPTLINYCKADKQQPEDAAVPMQFLSATKSMSYPHRSPKYIKQTITDVEDLVARQSGNAQPHFSNARWVKV